MVGFTDIIYNHYNELFKRNRLAEMTRAPLATTKDVTNQTVKTWLTR